MEWFCNTESHPSFAESKDFLEHMHAVHLEPLDEKQLLSLHGGFQRPSNAHSGICTLCGHHASRLKSHLARHLEQLALFAIPQTDYMATLEENDTSSNAARQGVPTQSSLGSTRIASDPSRHESDSAVSDGSNGSLAHSIHRSRAAADEQYIEQNEGSALISSDDVPEEVDTSWDQITSKFKDARVGVNYQKEAEIPERRPAITRVATDGEIVDASMLRSPQTLLGTSSKRPDGQPQAIDVKSYRGPLQRRNAFYLEPGAAQEPAPWVRPNIRPEPTTSNAEPVTLLEPLSPAIRERAGRMTTDLFSPFRNQGQDRHGRASPHDRYADRVSGALNVAPGIARTESKASVPSGQGPDIHTDSNPKEGGVNAKEKQTWRQRLSRAIGIKDNPT